MAVGMSLSPSSAGLLHQAAASAGSTPPSRSQGTCRGEHLPCSWLSSPPKWSGMGTFAATRFAPRGGVSVADQVEVVDPGRWRRVGADFGFGAGVYVAADLVADRDTHIAALVADLEVGQIEGVEDELDAASDQRGVDFVGVTEQGYRRGLGDQASLGPQECL